MANDSNIKKKVLMIDDDEVHLSIAETVLKDDYDVFKTTSGDEALGYLYNKKIAPDIILIDVLMPEMDGWEVYRRIRSINVYKSTPVVFLTSVDEESEKQRARAIGAVDYITKPYNKSFLKKTIDKIMEVRSH